MITDTISYLELLTFILLLAGFSFTSKSLSLVVEDMHRLRKKADFIQNGPRHRLAKRNVRSELGKLSSILLFLFAVILLMFAPPATSSGTYTVRGVITIFAILNTLFVMAVDTGMYLRDRTIILDLIDEENRNKAASLIQAAEATVEAASATVEAAVVTVETTSTQAAAETAAAAELTVTAAEEVVREAQKEMDNSVGY